MRKIFMLSFLLMGIVSLAQTVKTVSANYTLYAPESMTVEEAKLRAMDRAKIQAIAEEFGTNVSQSNSTVITNINGESDSQFFSFGGSDVKGEWIETISEPKFDIRYDKGMLVVEVSVKGKIRQISSSKVELSVSPLKNGTEKRFASTDFKDGDEFFLDFVSPANGFLSLWLVADDGETAYRILPYQRSGGELYAIEANKEYIFFSPSKCLPEESVVVDEFEMSTDKDVEINELYVIFSPQNYSPLIQKTTPEGIHYASNKTFKEWLAKFQRNISDAVVKKCLIKISK